MPTESSGYLPVLHTRSHSGNTPFREPALPILNSAHHQGSKGQKVPLPRFCKAQAEAAAPTSNPPRFQALKTLGDLKFQGLKLLASHASRFHLGMTGFDGCWANARHVRVLLNWRSARHFGDSFRNPLPGYMVENQIRSQDSFCFFFTPHR